MRPIDQVGQRNIRARGTGGNDPFPARIDIIPDLNGFRFGRESVAHVVPERRGLLEVPEPVVIGQLAHRIDAGGVEPVAAAIPRHAEGVEIGVRAPADPVHRLEQHVSQTAFAGRPCRGQPGSARADDRDVDTRFAAHRCHFSGSVRWPVWTRSRVCLLTTRSTVPTTRSTPMSCGRANANATLLPGRGNSTALSLDPELRQLGRVDKNALGRQIARLRRPVQEFSSREVDPYRHSRSPPHKAGCSGYRRPVPKYARG